MSDFHFWAHFLRPYPAFRHFSAATEKGPFGPFSMMYRLPMNSIHLHLERETRLASGLRAVEIKGLSVFPEMGIALILDSLFVAFNR